MQLDEHNVYGATTTCPLVQTDYILWIIVTNGLQITKFTLTCRFIGHKISGLNVNHLIITASHEVYLTATGQLSRINFIFYLV